MPGQSGYSKRLRAALPQIKRVIRVLAMNTDFWDDTVWLADSTPGAVWDVAAGRCAQRDRWMGR